MSDAVASESRALMHDLKRKSSSFEESVAKRFRVEHVSVYPGMLFAYTMPLNLSDEKPRIGCIR